LRFLFLRIIQWAGHRGDKAVRQPVGRSGQTRKDRGVHHTPAQLVVISHVRPRVHAGPGLLYLQRVAQTIGAVPGAGRTRLQAHAQPGRFRYGSSG